MLLAAKLAEVIQLLIAQPSRRLAVQRNAWAGCGGGCARPAEAEQLGGGALSRNNAVSTFIRALWIGVSVRVVGWRLRTPMTHARSSSDSPTWL